MRYKATRESFIPATAQRVACPNCPDEVAVGYVYAQRPGARYPFAYLVFLGKQAKPAHHLAARSLDEARQKVQQLLANALTAAQQRSEYQQTRKAMQKTGYRDEERGGIAHRYYTTAGTAALIRGVLKAAFPAVTFSVRSSEFSGGSSVDIDWTDGPTEQAVEVLVGKFAYGTFDSMQDLAGIKEPETVIDEAGTLRVVHYGARFVHTHRRYSPAYGHHCQYFDLYEQPAVAAQVEAWYELTRRQYAHDTTAVQRTPASGCWLIETTTAHQQLEAFGRNLQAQGVAVEWETLNHTTYLAIYHPAERETGARVFEQTNL